MSSDVISGDMPRDLVIDARNVGKCYHVYERPSHRLLQGLVGGSRRYYSEFWALRGVDLAVRKGQTVGIIGRNGSGKSTFLQMLAGTLAPTEGSIHVEGRVAALLELGSGFNPEFTGRENVYLNAAILGLTKAEVDARLDSILAFADIGQFIDQPIRNYSSGMVVRLAFAVQAQVQPQLLIVDEALSVGDAKFQAKCFARLQQLKDDGASILLVSHSADQIVQHCDFAMLLDGGRKLQSGKPKHVVNSYYNLLFGTGEAQEAGDSVAHDGFAEASAFAGTRQNDLVDRYNTRPNYNPHEFRWGDCAARILDFELRSPQAVYPAILESGTELRLAIRVYFVQQVVRPILGVTIKTAEGVSVYGTNSEYKPLQGLGPIVAAGSVLDVTASFRCILAEGDYFVSLGIASRDDGDAVVPHDRRYDSIHFKVMKSDFFGMSDLGLDMQVLQSAENEPGGTAVDDAAEENKVIR
ncbi:ABC transporter ATP-binding protein [Xanthomonas arboricola]|uniref:ABC transporter ATP-binding protein n=1 Tax=Xanthomonas arboricola TaxID=56448 RepID=UPI0017F95B50|nr:ABC transporter ATP-binding protein [Xanthomonas arboricola]MBB6258800.1 lipopolysaccharide transport system ATP-binding protein [Xanthomonas arboricola]